MKVNRVDFHSAPHHAPACDWAVYAAAQKQKSVPAHAHWKAARAFLRVSVHEDFFADFYVNRYVRLVDVYGQKFFVVNSCGGGAAYRV